MRDSDVVAGVAAAAAAALAAWWYAMKVWEVKVVPSCFSEMDHNEVVRCQRYWGMQGMMYSFSFDQFFWVPLGLLCAGSGPRI